MERRNSNYGVIEQNRSRENENGISRNLAIEKADSGDFENAIIAFTQLIKANPNDTALYFARATLKTSIGDIEGARRDFEMCEICDNKNNSDIDYYPLV